MSDEKPFAWYEPETDTVRLDGSDVSRMCWRDAIDAINAAVAARERKAAAKALREVAEYIEAMTEDDSLTAAHVSYIRARADSIEKGEA